MSEINVHYIFAYGSLIWRPDFDYTGKKHVVVHDYERRFWQASHDHRGTPEHPGRVVTIVPVKHGRCEGVIYSLPAKGRENILAMLDDREQDGYERAWIDVDDVHSSDRFKALTWIASENNPSWAGEESLQSTAQLIACRQGPSGSNRDYLLQLHRSLMEMGIPDPHIEALVEQVRRSS